MRHSSWISRARPLSSTAVPYLDQIPEFDHNPIFVDHKLRRPTELRSFPHPKSRQSSRNTWKFSARQGSPAVIAAVPTAVAASQALAFRRLLAILHLPYSNILTISPVVSARVWGWPVPPK